jgi:integrase
MKYATTKPRKLASGKRVPYYGVRIQTESAYEEQALAQLYPKLGKAPKGRETEAGTRAWMDLIRRAVEHRAYLLSVGMPVQDTEPIEVRIAEYLEWGRDRGGKKNLPWGAGHAEHIEEYLRAWVSALGLKTLSDIRQAPFDREITKLGKSFAPNTVNHRARCLTGLCTWAVREKYLPTSPIQFQALDKTPLKERGAFALDELRTLFQGAPWARGVLYRAAYYLRLRRGELASLRVRDALWSEGLIRLDFRNAKDRKTAFIPVPASLMADLWTLAEGRPEDAPLIPFSKKKAALNLDRDMQKLGIPKMLSGRRRDFHSLGASTATSMSRHKIAPALAQKTMRHKSWAQTEAYIKLETDEVRAVSQGLEDEIEHTEHARGEDMSRTTEGAKGYAGKGSNPSPSALSSRTLKFPQKSRTPRKEPLVTFARFQEITTHLRHTLSQPGAAADVEAFLKLSPAQRLAALAQAKKAAG